MVPRGMYHGAPAGVVTVEVIEAVHRSQAGTVLAAMVLRRMLGWPL